MRVARYVQELISSVIYQYQNQMPQGNQRFVLSACSGSAAHHILPIQTPMVSPEAIWSQSNLVVFALRPFPPWTRSPASDSTCPPRRRRLCGMLAGCGTAPGRPCISPPAVPSHVGRTSVTPLSPACSCDP